MAKDPAFLFYPNDWIGGTMGMSFQEKGAYMELLVLQFNRGHMTSHMIGQVVGQIWDSLKHKFLQDENGLWYNERLDIEKKRRKAFTESRLNNKNGKNQYSKTNNKSGHMRGHTTSHMENENENNNNNNNGIAKTKNPLDVEYPIENCKDIALKDQRWCEKNKITPKDLDEFNAWLEKGGVYQHHVGEYKTYYRNWRNSKKKHIEPSKPLKPFSHV